MKKSIFFVSLLALICIMNGDLWSQKEHSVLSDPYNPGILAELSKDQSPGRNSVNAYFFAVGYATTNGLYSTPFPGFTPIDFIAGNEGKIYYGGDIGPNGIYYCISASFELMSIDRASGAATFIANVTGIAAANITGMTYHEATDIMYVSTSSQLFTVNLSTGAASFIGNFTTEMIMIFIAINCEGEMYGVDIAGDVLVKINPATGATTIVGPTNFSANYAQGGDFDDATGTLYWAAYQGSGVSSIRTLDLGTGNSTLVIDTNPYEIDSLVIENNCGKSVPVSDWAVYFGLLIIITFTIIRFRKIS